MAKGFRPSESDRWESGKMFRDTFWAFEKSGLRHKDKLYHILESIWKPSKLFSIAYQSCCLGPFHRHYQIYSLFCSFQCNTAYQCLLIADQHCRTRKYFLCLASGIPCVSHVWVHDSCHANQLQNYRNYLLPAGYSLEEQKILDWWVFESPSRAEEIGRQQAFGRI